MGGCRGRTEVPGTRLVRDTNAKASGALKIAMSDTDYDGLMDLVVFRDRGPDGTQILTFETPPSTPYGTLALVDDLTDTVEWTGLRPY